MSNQKSGLFMFMLFLLFIIPFLLIFAHNPQSIQATQSSSVSSGQDTEQLFFYPNFTSTNSADLSLVGDAAIYQPESALRLTSTSPCCQAGAAWHTTQQQVGNGFETTFDFRMTTNGADGFAFVIHDDPDGLNTIGNAGCGLGYDDINRSLAIEFDTYANPPFCEYINDPNGNHISIHTNGTGPNSPAHNYSLGHYTSLSELSNGQIYTVKIRYTTDESNLLEVYLYQEDDDINAPVAPVLSVEIDLEETLDLTDGLAWVGFTAATGTTLQNHDILNWYFVDTYILSCLEYDFTLPYGGSHVFLATQGGWLGEQRGWGSSNGTVQVHRGIANTAHPILAASDGFDPRILAMIHDENEPLPIKEVQLVFEGISGPYTDPLNGTYTLLNGDGTLVSGNWSINPPTLPVDSNGWFITSGVMDEVVTQPTGMEVGLQATANTVNRLKKAALCVDAGPPPRPPVIPPGGVAACQDLLDHIKTRQQPFGDGMASQPEFQFPDEVILVPYPEYSLNNSAYPNPTLTYSGLPTSQSLVPCVFMLDDEIYNPTTPGKPIVRFTTVGSDYDMRERVSLLNYAAYFSVGSPNWCYAGDNVYGSINERDNANNYGAGYNVTSPKYRCDLELRTVNNLGPCGTFVGSLFRAMGYYNVDGFANAFGNPHLTNVLVNLYYGVDAYIQALPNNISEHTIVSQPFVRPDNSSPAYTPLPVSFSAVRVYPLDNGERIYGYLGQHHHPINCNSEEEACQRARNRVEGHWNKPIEKALSPHHRGSSTADPELLWQQIRPGDIAITVIERGEPGNLQVPANDLNTHIQVVVGWGPPVSQFSAAGVRQGFNFFPTYADIPDDQENKEDYIPYVMDRYSLPGTGGVPGPRPFSYFLWHTATDFWITHVNSTHQFEDFESDGRIAETERPDRAAFSLSTHGPEGVPVAPLAPNSIAWSPDGNWIAAGGSFGLLLYPPSLEYGTHLSDPSTTIVDVAWRPDSSRLASAHAAQQIKIWDVTSSDEIGTLRGHTAELTSLAWSPNDDYLASSAKDGTVRLWDPNSLSLAATLPYTGSSYIEALAWNFAGNKLAGADASTLYVWDINSGQIVNTVSLSSSTGRSLAWTPDDQYLVTAGPQLWQATTGESLGVYAACSAGKDTLAVLSPDGQYLAGAGVAQTGSAACVLELDETYYQVDQHFLQTFDRIEAISDLAWHPQALKIATTTQSGWLQIWDAVTGQLETTATRPNVTLRELENMVVACVANGPFEYQLTQTLVAGDYAGFIDQLGAQEELIAPGCIDQLVSTAEFLENNPPLPPGEEVIPQPLTITGICTPDANAFLNWQIRNPNPYEALVYWGWEELAPESGGSPIVVPAAVAGQPGQWILQTPVHPDGQTLQIVSGGFTATATANLSPCSLWLPAILSQ